ncbi:MAG: threonine/serine ThrE exporter family protein [Fusobacteriaceae bacterium]
MEAKLGLREKKENIYRVALFMGEILLKNGCETSKVEQLCREFCDSKKYRHVTIFVTPTVLMIGDDRADGITFMKGIKDRTTNLHKLVLINKFILKLTEDSEIDCSRALQLLKKIDRYEIYSILTKQLCAGIASASFVMVFNATPKDAAITFIVSIISLFISNFISRMIPTVVLGTIVASFFIGISGLLTKHYGIATSDYFIIVGSILPHLPGVALTKSISDLVSGDFLSGNSRITESFLIATSIGIGVATALNVWVKFGGVING